MTNGGETAAEKKAAAEPQFPVQRLSAAPAVAEHPRGKSSSLISKPTQGAILSIAPLSTSLNTAETHRLPVASIDGAVSGRPCSPGKEDRLATAVVYCEANFGAIDGKTANGLVRHSEMYEILSVIDSEKAGLDAGVVLGDGGALLEESPQCRLCSFPDRSRHRRC